MAATRAPGGLAEAPENARDIEDGTDSEQVPGSGALFSSEEQDDILPQKISQVLQEILPLLNSYCKTHHSCTRFKAVLTDRMNRRPDVV